jgi:hypothetical protein
MSYDAMMGKAGGKPRLELNCPHDGHRISSRARRCQLRHTACRPEWRVSFRNPSLSHLSNMNDLMCGSMKSFIKIGDVALTASLREGDGFYPKLERSNAERKNTGLLEWR